MTRNSGRRERSGRSGRARVCVAAGALVMVCGLVWVACGPVSEPIEFSYSVLDVSLDSLPPVGTQAVYKYRLPTANPDSILRRLLRARIPVNEAWETSQADCGNEPEGPRFTVLITEPDSRLESNNFVPGNGILPCSVRVRRYLIIRNFL